MAKTSNLYLLRTNKKSFNFLEVKKHKSFVEKKRKPLS